MNVRVWHEVEALISDLAFHRHEMVGATEDEAKQRTRDRYPNGVVLVREKEHGQTKEEKR